MPDHPCGTCSSPPTHTDTYYKDKNPDWGGQNRGLPDQNFSNDPSLDVDNVSGYGPENINLNNLFDHSVGATIGVHYFCDSGAGNVEARVRIYISGDLAFEATHSLLSTEFWEVAHITVSDNGSTVGINPANSTNSWVQYPSCH